MSKLENTSLNSRKGGNLTSFIGTYGIYLVFLLIVAVLSIASPTFMSVVNITNVLRQVSINGIISVGMTFVIIAGGIDLSVGSILGIATIVCTSFSHPGQSVVLSCAIGLAVGLACGLANGLLIAYGEVPPFIITLGMLTIARGLTLLYNNGRPVIDLSDEYTEIGGGSFLGVPNPIIVFAVIAILAYCILKFTKFGRHVYAIGGNELSAKVSGINVNLVKTLVYTITGGLSAVSGIILSSRVMTGSPVAGEGYELDAIAACVIGGASLSGGLGGIPGTIVGALLIGVMTNGLDLLKVSSYYQDIAKGVIIILAVLIDIKSKKRKSK